MVWPRVKEGRGGYHQEDVKHASARKEKKGEAQEKMVGQYQGGHERVQDDERHGTKSKCLAREDKGRPIATWRRPLSEKKVRNIALPMSHQLQTKHILQLCFLPMLFSVYLPTLDCVPLDQCGYVQLNTNSSL